MTAFIMNPRPLGSAETILLEVRSWLQTCASLAAPSNQIVFDNKWGSLGPDDRLILAAIIEEGGQDVKEVSVRRRLVEQYGIERSRASSLIRESTCPERK